MAAWKEHRPRVSAGHRDKISGPMHQGEAPPEISSAPNIIPEYLYCVRTCGFTFKFWSVEQIREALRFYSQKTHPGSRMPNSKWLRAEHDAAQRWYERVPLRLQEEGRRQRVVKALERALDDFS